MSDNDLIRQVADRQAITDLIYRYCRAIDRIEPALGYTIWHDDATADYGEGVYQGTGRGFIDAVCERHRNLVAHSHQVTNIIIDLDGDRAGSEAYVTATLRLENEGRFRHKMVWGRYIDRWSRRDGRWGIDKRVYLHDFEEIYDVGPIKAICRGRRDTEDASYDALGELGRREIRLQEAGSGA
jgi:hypothetical protein